MATIEWIPRRDRRQGTKRRKVEAAEATKVTRVFASVLWLAACCLPFAGCQTTANRTLVNKPVSFRATSNLDQGLIGKAQSKGAPSRTASPDIQPESGAIGRVSFQEDADQSLPLGSDQNDSRRSVRPQLQQPQTSDASQPDSATRGRSPDRPGFDNSMAGKLTLPQLLRSVADCYPEIEVAIGEIETARGKILASWGEFDTIASSHNISQPLGFYQTYRNGAQLSQPLYNGGEVYGTYRIGDGNFEPWYGERETNEGGEFKAGFSLPLIKNRIIDERRANVQAAELTLDQVQSNVDARLLQFERLATEAYWSWVASGQAVQIQEQLLALALDRVEGIDERMRKGDLARITENDNDRFIAKRKNGIIKANRELRKAAFKMSLFLRDGNCQPVIASEDMLPKRFPQAEPIDDGQLMADIENALATRPELRELAALEQRTRVELNLANNSMLPKLDVKGFAGQDVGGETSSKGDKTPFELQVGFFAEVPLQRREGAGKARAACGKLTQIAAKRQMVSDKIRAEIQDSANAVNLARDQIAQLEEQLRLNLESLRLQRLSYDAGNIDLLQLNFYETDVADARLELLEAQFKYFANLARYLTTVRNQAFIDR